MDSEDGELFVKQLASFVRTHEKALANALQVRRQTGPRHAHSQSTSSAVVPPSTALPERPTTSASPVSPSSSRASSFSLGPLKFSTAVKSAKLALTPHHLFYLLSRFEELAIPVGPMKIRLENLHDSSTSANYVSFLSNTQRSRSRGSDVGSIHSVSSVRSVMSGMSALWASFGIGASISAARIERQKAALQADLKYLYSAFTKIPCLRLAPDRRARLIRGYEEFPFDSAVPLYVFKNVQALEVSSIDFRQFFGWDRLADQLKSLTLRRASVEDPADLLVDIVLDDLDRRRRRSSKAHGSSAPYWPPSGHAPPRRSQSMHHPGSHKSFSAPGSPDPRNSVADLRVGSVPLNENAIDDPSPKPSRRPSIATAEDADEPASPTKPARPRSHSPGRPTSSRNQTVPARVSFHRMRRSGSGSSHSSLSDSWHVRASSGNLISNVLPPTKWRFLRHFGLPDNSLTAISAASLAPLSDSLQSLDLSANLFTQIPDSLATLTGLRALNLSNCMIDSLHSLTRNPLPAISALNLRGNRLQSLAGIERLYPLERLDLRENALKDPSELARLTGIPDIREIWVDGNPFTRTHRNYRVIIFNLFRTTPGYTEDLIIDGTGPSYSEKRQLADRVPIPAAVPVVKPLAPKVPEVEVAKQSATLATREVSVLRKERPVLKPISSEANTASTRRRKMPKRRIVDLAVSGAPVARAISADAVEADSNYHVYSPREAPELPPATPTKALTPLAAETPRIESRLVAELPLDYPTGFPSSEAGGNDGGWKGSQDWDGDGDLYRRKMEALRDKVENSYLSVLSEESWDVSRTPPFVAAKLNSPSPIRPPPTTSGQTVSAPAINGGRTLG